MKTLLALTLSLCALSSPAFAHEYTPKEILATLIENAGRVQLVDEEGKQMNLAKVLAETLATDASVAEGQAAGVNSVTGACEEMGDGSAKLGCGLQITQGAFVATKDGLRGPEASKEYFLTFRAKRGPGGKLVILGQVNYSKAL